MKRPVDHWNRVSSIWRPLITVDIPVVIAYCWCCLMLLHCCQEAVTISLYSIFVLNRNQPHTAECEIFGNNNGIHLACDPLNQTMYYCYHVNGPENGSRFYRHFFRNSISMFLCLCVIEVQQSNMNVFSAELHSHITCITCPNSDEWPKPQCNNAIRIYCRQN